MANVYEAFSFADATVTGKVIGDLTIDYCKTMAGAAVSQVGMTLVELGVGDYVLMNPNVTERTVCRLKLTADTTKRAVVMFDPVDGDIAKQSNPGSLSNQVEDDIVRDANGLKTSSNIYVYDSAANAIVHDKVTGLTAKHAVTVTYTAQRMTTFKSVRTV